MKKKEYERLATAILEGIGEDNLNRIKTILTYRKINYKETIDKFINNISSFVFTRLSKFGMVQETDSIYFMRFNTSNNTKEDFPSIKDWLKEKKDYIEIHFSPSIAIISTNTRKSGVFFSFNFQSFVIHTEYDDVLNIIEEERQRKAQKRVDDYQKQQFKWAARQGSRKK